MRKRFWVVYAVVDEDTSEIEEVACHDAERTRWEWVTEHYQNRTDATGRLFTVEEIEVEISRRGREVLDADADIWGTTRR